MCCLLGWQPWRMMGEATKALGRTAMMYLILRMMMVSLISSNVSTALSNADGACPYHCSACFIGGKSNSTMLTAVFPLQRREGAGRRRVVPRSALARREHRQLGRVPKACKAWSWRQLWIPGQGRTTCQQQPGPPQQEHSADGALSVGLLHPTPAHAAALVSALVSAMRSTVRHVASSSLPELCVSRAYQLSRGKADWQVSTLQHSAANCTGFMSSSNVGHISFANCCGCKSGPSLGCRVLGCCRLCCTTTPGSAYLIDISKTLPVREGKHFVKQNHRIA